MSRTTSMMSALRMNASTNLVILVHERLWPAIQSLAHFQRRENGLRRLFLCHPAGSRESADSARRLERFVRRQFPALDVTRREVGAEPRHLRRQLDSWYEDAPGDAWIVDLTGAPRTLAWGAESWIGRERCQLVHREAGRDWFEIRRSPEGDVEAAPFTAIRRDAGDEIPAGTLVRTLSDSGGEDAEFHFDAREVEALPMVALSEAAMSRDWRWAEAFRAAGVDPGTTPDSQLFERYVGGLLLALGVSRIARSRRSKHESSTDSQLWIQRDGRLVVLEMVLPPAGDSAEKTADELALRIQDAAMRYRSLAALGIEPWLILPGERLAPADAALAAALGVGVLDQSACHELPGRLATLFGLPLSPDGAEIERQLRQHVTDTGRTRIFCDEPTALQAPRGADSDPAWADVDAWLDNILRQRGQNWLLWSHRGNGYLRLPVDGRPEAASEWRQLASAIARLDPQEVRVNMRGNTVVLEFPGRAEIRRWLSEWLQPFLNKPVRFAEAQLRFAARARVEAEAAQAMGVPSPPAPAAARPVKSTAKAPAPAARPPAKPAQQRSPGRDAERPPINPLADLDQALDAALGGGN